MNDKSLFFLHDNATENTSHAASSLARPTPSRAWGKEGGEVEGGGSAIYRICAAAAATTTTTTKNHQDANRLSKVSLSHWYEAGLHLCKSQPAIAERLTSITGRKSWGNIAPLPRSIIWYDNIVQSWPSDIYRGISRERNPNDFPRYPSATLIPAPSKKTEIWVWPENDRLLLMSSFLLNQWRNTTSNATGMRLTVIHSRSISSGPCGIDEARIDHLLRLSSLARKRTLASTIHSWRPIITTLDGLTIDKTHGRVLRRSEARQNLRLDWIRQLQRPVIGDVWLRAITSISIGFIFNDACHLKAKGCCCLARGSRQLFVTNTSRWSGVL